MHNKFGFIQDNYTEEPTIYSACPLPSTNIQVLKADLQSWMSNNKPDVKFETPENTTV